MDNNTTTPSVGNRSGWTRVGSVFEYEGSNGRTEGAGGVDTSDYEDEGLVTAWIDIEGGRTDVQRDFSEGDSASDGGGENSAFDRALRWVEAYAGLDGSRIPLDDSGAGAGDGVGDNDGVVNILELQGGEDIDIRFFHDVENSEKVNPGEWEVGHRFVRMYKTRPGGESSNSGHLNGEWRAVFSSPGTGRWEAYLYAGDWAYGSSAERFEVRPSSVTAGGE